MSTPEGRSLRSLLALPVARLSLVAAGVAVAVGLLSFLLFPASYESQASVVFSVSTQQVSTQMVSGQLLSNLPSPAALAQAFTQRLETRAFSQLLDDPAPPDTYSARFEGRSGLLILKAFGGSREEARQRAEKLVAVAQSFLQERLAAAARANVASALELARVDFRTGEQVLREVRDLLKAPPKKGSVSSPETAARLEVMAVPPPVARSSNPAETYLNLQEAQLSSQVATSRARMEALEGVLKDPETLSRLVGQALQVQVLSLPAEPVRKTSPKPTLWAGASGLAVLAAGVLFGLLRDALR
jgi:uncharacterized protein involved in exopolysaccharide biosynthesis